MAVVDPMVRLVNLTQMLLEASKPLTLREIDERLEGMSGTPETRRKTLERAKSDLRGVGIPIEVVQLPSGETGYTINPSAVVLNVILDDEESIALASALAMVRVEGKPPLDLASKLGYIISGNTSAFVDLARPELLGALYKAATRAKVVSFRYSDTLRKIEIHQISSRWGRWYLTGRDVSLDSIRTFRVDRINGPIEIIKDSHYQRPTRPSKGRVLSEQAWFVDDDNLKYAKIRVGETDAKIIRSSGLASSVIAVGEGLWECEFAYSEESGLRAFFFELSKLPQVISSEELRVNFYSWIEATQKRYLGSPIINWEAVDIPPVVDKKPSRKRAKLPNGISFDSAKDRFALLTRLLPLLQSQSEMSISELAASFGIGRPQLVSLLETAATCGLPPYTPDALFEIFVDVDEDRVYVNVDSKLALPRKIDYVDALVFRFSASVISAYLKGESDALNRALLKLEDALIGEVDAGELVSVGISSSPQLEVVRESIDKGCTIEFEYFSQSSKEIKLWEAEPVQVFARDGHFYIAARVVESGEMRTFRASRCLSVKEGRAIDALAATPETEISGPLSVSEDTKFVHLEVDISGMRQLELIAPSYLSVLGFQDDCWLVSIPVVSNKWLNTTLLKLGPHALLVGNDDLKEDFLLLTRALLSEFRTH